MEAGQDCVGTVPVCASVCECVCARGAELRTTRVCLRVWEGRWFPGKAGVRGLRGATVTHFLCLCLLIRAPWAGSSQGRPAGGVSGGCPGHPPPPASNWALGPGPPTSHLDPPGEDPGREVLETGPGQGPQTPADKPGQALTAGDSGADPGQAQPV